MTDRRTPAPLTPAWDALAGHWQQVRDVHMRDLFRADPGRFERFSAEAAGLYLDYSKNRITDETRRLLVALARSSGLHAAMESMFRGEPINLTEERAALHTALRSPGGAPVLVDGVDVLPAVQAVRARMRAFVHGVHSGTWRGCSGRPVRDVVNIGIGGSDLGPRMATAALRPFHRPGLRVHFAANVDAAELMGILQELDPETTLFVIASKTFTTQETLANAHTARNWFEARCGREPAAIARHFVALSSNAEAVAAFGIDPGNMFEFWDWVGGRYSLWSAIGLPIALAVGMERFEELLAGAHDMDRHFREAPFERNLPVLLGLLGVWYNNLFDAASHAVVPYEQLLELLPAHLQQLDMESSGKGCGRDGARVAWHTGPVIWGAPGTNGQHAFFQLLHQGTRLIPVDFLLGMHSHYPVGEHQSLLMANCLAQAEALMRGKAADEVAVELEAQGLAPARRASLAPHKVFEGNRPSNVILYDKLTPRVLGAIIALYEHKVFVQAWLWNVNAFDQWGVELGKQLAGRILRDFRALAGPSGHDASTNGLIRRCRDAMGKP